MLKYGWTKWVEEIDSLKYEGDEEIVSRPPVQVVSRPPNGTGSTSFHVQVSKTER